MFSKFCRAAGRFCLGVVACIAMSASLQAHATGTLVQASTGSPSGYQVLAAGLDVLSNGNKISAYLQQTSGDAMTYSPNAPGFDGIVKVLDAGNTVQATINITAAHLSDPVNNYLQDMRVAPLLNGGFVVVWTEVDKATSSIPANFYALFDNAGTLTKSTSALASVSGYAPQVVGLTGGGFATAVLNGSKVYVNTYAYAAGNYVHNTETTVGDSTNPAPNPGSDPDIGKLGFLGGLNLAALSDGSFVITGAVYDWVSSNYTPLGDFVFKLASDGTAANFATGVNYARVN